MAAGAFEAPRGVVSADAGAGATIAVPTAWPGAAPVTADARVPLTDPTTAYLGSLSPKGRQTMVERLRAVATLIGVPYAEIVWHDFRFQHVDFLRQRLLEQGRSPATVNLTLAAFRGIARYARNLNLISAEEYDRIRDVKAARGSHLPAGRAILAGELGALVRHLRHSARFRHPFEATDLYRPLDREMDASGVTANGRVYVSNVYRVRVHPQALLQMTDTPQELQRDLNAYVERRIAGNAWRTIADIAVFVGGDVNLRPGDVRVESWRDGRRRQQLVRAIGETALYTAEGARQPTLQVLVGPERGKEFLLPSGRIRIGRAQTNHLVLWERSVSFAHAQVECDAEGNCWIENLSRSNPVRVNDCQIDKAELRDGDNITLGRVWLRYRVLEGDEEQPTSMNGPR